MSFISDYLLITPASGKIDSTSTQIAPIFSQGTSKPNKIDPVFSKIAPAPTQIAPIFSQGTSKPNKIDPDFSKIAPAPTQIAPVFSLGTSKPNKIDPDFSKITSLSNKMNIKSQMLGQLIILIYLSPATTPHKQVAYCQKPVASRQPPNYPPINSFSGIRSCSVYLPSSKVATKFLLIW